jgi:hypothetical protein
VTPLTVFWSHVKNFALFFSDDESGRAEAAEQSQSEFPGKRRAAMRAATAAATLDF